MEDDHNRVERMTRVLCGELFKALGFKKDGTIAKVLSPLARKPIQRFAEISVGFDQRVIQEGFQEAAKWIMPNFAPMTEAAGVSHIPQSGPFIIASNHPGAYDSLVITSNVPRDDIKIIVNIPLDFITEIPATLSHFLYAPPNTFVRMNVVRAAIQHLKSGGGLLLFASGRIDPDPSTMDGAEQELDRWSRSLEVMMRKVPETNLLISIVSDILHPKYINHVFTWFRKERPDKQRISEFFQVMSQMVTSKTHQLIPRVTFSRPFTLEYLMECKSGTDIVDVIQSKAKQLLHIHQNAVLLFVTTVFLCAQAI